MPPPYKPARRPVEHLMTHENDISGVASDFARMVYRCMFRDGRFKAVYQCSGYWADGYIITIEGENIPFEIKDTLGWGSLCAALVQLISISSALPLRAASGWIVFENYSSAWAKNPAGALNHAMYCASKFHAGLDIHLVHVGRDCSLTTQLAVTAA